MSHRPPATLRRSLTLPSIVLYGLGTTIGAGIYALMGAVAGTAGLHAWAAFGVASLLASVSAASFAEMSARHPHSAGEAVYVREGLGWRGFPTGVGLLVTLAGCVSAATISNAFVGYLATLILVPREVGLTVFVGGLGLIALWGVRQSVWTAAAVTVIEIGGLLLVIAFAGNALGDLPERLPELLPPLRTDAWWAVLSASLLAFYAYIGFEDMVNMAEEVVDVRRTLPLAIGVTLGVTTVLYVLLALVAVLTLPPAELAASDAPLFHVYERAGGPVPELLGTIGVVAMLNGALIQIVMAARVLYGLATQGGLPAPLARVNVRTRTPDLATALATALVLMLALGFPLAPLARATSLITLVVFALVNLSLARLQGREPVPAGVWRVPRPVPILGFLASAGLVLWEMARLLGA